MTEELHSLWQKAKKPLEVFGIIVVCVLGTALIAVIVLAYVFHVNVPGLSGKNLWDWFELLIIPIVLAGGGFLFNLAMSRNQQEVTSDNQREAALQAYINNMSELLLEKHLRESAEDDEARRIARVRTLTVLGGLDRMRKRSVLLFLHEAGLLDRGPEDTREPIINLWDADFSQAHLSRAHLKGVSLSKANLRGADLSRTYLEKAKFHKAVLIRANLSNDNRSAVSPDEEPNLRGADLRGAYLINANLHNADLRGADLTGADLRGANLKRAKYNTKPMQGKDAQGKPVMIEPTQWPQGFDPKKVAGLICVEC